MRNITAGTKEDEAHVQDVKIVYFYDPATRDMYVELPPARAQPGMCAKPHKSFHGNRGAALNWAQAYWELLEGMGFVKGLSSPCSFYYEAWEIRTVVHGDGFLSEGPGKNLEEMDKEMRKSFACRLRFWGVIPEMSNLSRS